MEKTTAATRVIEIQADSLKAARAEAESRVTEGLCVISEKILSDGNTKSEEGIGETVEAALSIARKRIPEGAKIVDERTVKETSWNTIEIEAADDDSAATSVKRKIGKTARIEKIELKTPGRKGILGIGATPPQYLVRVLQPAVVQVQYKFPVRILVEYGEPKGPTYRNGDVVECGRCSKSMRVEYQNRKKDSAQFSVVDPAAIRSTALRCQGCGFIVCFSCATPSGEGVPVCPSCHAQGGPYFFVH